MIFMMKILWIIAMDSYSKKISEGDRWVQTLFALNSTSGVRGLLACDRAAVLLGLGQDAARRSCSIVE